MSDALVFPWEDGTRVITAPPPLLTRQQILESAECVPEKDYQEAKRVIKEAYRASLDPMDIAQIRAAAVKKSKIPKSEFEDFERGLRRGVSEDFGRKLAVSTLNRFYNAGDYIIRVAHSFWVYNGKFWERKDDEQVGHDVNRALLELPNPEGVPHSTAIGQAMQLIRVTSAKPEDVFSFTKDALPIVNCDNGELWIAPDGTHELKPHSHTSYQTCCLKVAYDPYAKCPVFDRTLEEIFANSKDVPGMVRHWLEIMGYAIQPMRHIACWFLLKGQGENGKSRLLRTMTEFLIGVHGVAQVKFDKLDGDKFAIGRLVGKLVAVENDMSKNARLPDGTLKEISELAWLEAEFKGKDSFPFLCRALPFMLSNHFPKTMDQSHGMLRRANVIPFKRIFRAKEGQADQDRFPHIWMHEMSGVLNRALQGTRRVIVRGRFDPPADCEEAVELWSCAVNPVKAFIREKLVPWDEHAESHIPWTTAWTMFQEWCKEENMKLLMGRNTVKREFASMGLNIKKLHGNDVIRGWVKRSDLDDAPEERADEY